jgi:hypothetical protein
MLRGSFPGHRRYSITHRAVQRFRELVPSLDDLDDETLRDRLDEALSKSEDDGKAVRTLDAMLGEPQVLIPVDRFGEILYAIIKEDTVVTVLPQGHGEEILQRGQALEQRVAKGEVPRRPQREEPERWEPRRRWRREAQAPVVIERPRSQRTEEAPLGGDGDSGGSVVQLSRPRRPDDPVAGALFDALERGRRRAAIEALREALGSSEPDDALLPIWNELASTDLPRTLTVGDLIEAIRDPA